MPKSVPTQKVRVALAQVNPILGDFKGNGDKVISFIRRASQQGVDLIAFPEMILTGYPPGDLLLKEEFIEAGLKTLETVALEVGDIVAVVGFAQRHKEELFSAAAVIFDKKIHHVYHKVFSLHGDFLEQTRYFSSGRQKSPVLSLRKAAFCVNICEDLPVVKTVKADTSLKGVSLSVNIAASSFAVGKAQLREGFLRAQAKASKVFLAYSNLVGGQDELVFDGRSVIIDDQGHVVARARGFSEELVIQDLDLKVSTKKIKGFAGLALAEHKIGLEKALLPPQESPIEELYNALAVGLKDYCFKNGFQKAVLGLSGGLDSAVVAAIAVEALGKENVIGVFLPSVYTSQESKEDARRLSEGLRIELKVISIQEIFAQYLEVLGKVFQRRPCDVTEENLQARIRGNIIMALSNRFGYFVLNTGNKSEVSCGYCTLYGDTIGGLGVLLDVPKTVIYELARYRNQKEPQGVIPERILKKPPTAELKANQKDSDVLPDYEFLDKVLKAYVDEGRGLSNIVACGVKEDAAAVMDVIRMVNKSEFKRRQGALPIQVTLKKSRRERRMPVTHHFVERGFLKS